jgi:hypothetical protein
VGNAAVGNEGLGRASRVGLLLFYTFLSFFLPFFLGWTRGRPVERARASGRTDCREQGGGESTLAQALRSREETREDDAGLLLRQTTLQEDEETSDDETG